MTLFGDGPDASLFSAISGVAVPVAPIQVEGRIRRHISGTHFQKVKLRLGEYHASVDGELGEFPKFIGTDLEVRASGPNLKLIEQLVNIPPFPERPFAVAAFFRGTPERFSVRDLALRFGSSDLKGDLEVNLVGRPKINSTLRSERLDFSRFLEYLEDIRPVAENEHVGSPQPVVQRDLLITDDKIDLSFLDKIDGSMRWQIHEVSTPGGKLSDLDLGIQISDGVFEAGPVSVRGERGGLLHGHLQIAPEGEGYGVHADIGLDHALLQLSKHVESNEQLTPMDFDLRLKARGRSLHELLSSATGRIVVVAGPGLVDGTLADLLVNNLLLETMSALSPATRKSDTAELECAIMLLRLEDGVGALYPFTIRTENMTVLGNGGIDFSTEEFELEGAVKPRSGVGFRASSVSNRYLRLGGTLSEPKIEVKTFEALTTTGIAVVTLGIYIFGRGLIDRISAEADVCEQAMTRLEAEGPASEAKWWRIWE